MARTVACFVSSQRGMARCQQIDFAFHSKTNPDIRTSFRLYRFFDLFLAVGSSLYLYIIHGEPSTKDFPLEAAAARAGTLIKLKRSRHLYPGQSH